MTIPLYDPDQPAPRDTYADSQPDFLANFSALYDSFAVNHIALDSLSNAGNHTNVQIIEQDTPPQTAPSDISFYVKKVENQTDQLFMRYPNNGQEVQISGYQIYSIDSPSDQFKQFFTYLPGGGIFYFGRFRITNKANVINLTPAICKSIVTVDINVLGPSARQKPWVSLITNNTNVITGIQVSPSFINGTPYFYLAWGNP